MAETPDYNPLLIKGAIDSGGPEAKIAEPILAQLDEWSRFTIMNLLYEFEVVDNPGSGQSEKRVKECNYPDIENAAGYALSHLNLLMNFTWEDRCVMILDWRNQFYKPLTYKYRRDKNARTIITALNGVYMRNTIGGSAGGSHQNFLWRYQGGMKGVVIEKGEKE